MAPSILGLASAILGIPTITTFIQNLISALTRNSEYIENVQCTRNQLQEFEDEDLLDKMSILLTPTAYSDGSLNTVIPPYQVLPTEFVTNGTFDTDLSGWTDTNNHWQWTNQGAYFSLTSTHNPLSQTLTNPVGVKLKFTFSLNIIQGTVNVYYKDTGNSSVQSQYTQSGTYTIETVAVKQNTDINFSRYAGINTEFYLDNVSVKEIQEADFDFSRGSSATRVNEQGLVEDVQILSGELVQNGNFEQIGSELVTNGGFDTDSNWNLSRAVIENGVGKFQESVGTFSRIRQDINFTGQTKVTYTISFNNSSNTTIQSRSYGGGNNQTIPAVVGTHTVYRNFTSDGVSFQTGGLAAGEEIHLDNVSVKEVGQNWTFGTGWSINDGKVYFDNPTGTEFRQSLATTAGKYRISFDLDITSGTIQTSFSSPSVSTIESFTTSGTKTVDITTTASFSRFRFVGLGNSVFNIDNVSVVKVTDDTDLPRIDYSPYSGSGTCGHLLLEPQRTNLITYSEDFSDSSWTKLGSGTGTTAIVTSDYAVSPDGSQNASRLQCDLNGGTTISDQSLIYDTISGSGDTSAFVYVKSNTSSNQTFYLANALNDRISAVATTEWKKFELNWNASGNGRSLSIGTRGTTGSDNTLDLLIWGAQVEAGSYATSYIPTSGSTVTRSAEAANNSGNADLFNDSEGVLYAEISIQGNVGNHQNITASDSSTNNYLKIIYLNNTNKIRGEIKGGGSSDFIDFTNIQFKQFYKVAISYKSSEFKMFVDGTQVGNTITSFNLPTGLNKLAFDRGDGGLDFYGNTKALAVFKEALSNNDLELLTGEGYNSFAALAAAFNYNVI